MRIKNNRMRVRNKLSLHTKWCRRCNKYFETPHKYGKICEKCKKKQKDGK